MDNNEIDLEELKKALQAAADEEMTDSDRRAVSEDADLLGDHTEQVIPDSEIPRPVGTVPESTEKPAAPPVRTGVPQDAGAAKGSGNGAAPAGEEPAQVESVMPEYDVDAIAAAVMASQEKVAVEAEKRAVREAKARKKRKKRKKTLKRLVITLLLLALVAGAGGIGYSFMTRRYRSHFLPGTTINGVDVSGLTAAEVKKNLLGVPDTYKLTIYERDGLIEELDADDLGRSYVDNSQVEDILRSQDASAWLFASQTPKDYTVSFDTDYDTVMAEQAVEALSCISGGGIISPQDAALEVDENGKYRIVPEVQGNKVNENKLKELIIRAVDNQVESIDLEAEDCYEKPKVFSDDEALVRRMNDFNAFLSVNVTYHFGPNEERIDGNTVRPYINDDGDTVTIATDWVRTLVHEWSRKYETFGMAREFKTHDGITIQIPAGGDYGWCLNDEKTVEDVIEAIETGATGDREPVWLYEAAGWDNGDLTGTYVEVSIPDQHLWCYKDYELVIDTDVKTGLPTEERHTNPGCFAIDGKKKNAVLGTFVTHGYSLPVQWWLPFDGDIGLHDAPWTNQFGGTYYRTSGSNGCVNIPTENMEPIFKTMEIGMAVVVYEDKTPYIPNVEDTQLAQQAAEEAGAAVDAEDTEG